MTSQTLLIADYIHQVEKRDAEIERLRKRVETAEIAWAKAVNEAREAQEELMHMRKELNEECD